LAVFPAAIGAYAAYLLHAGVDWDWELPGVTLVALVSGVSLLVTGRDKLVHSRSMPFRVGAATVALALSASAFVSVLANVPLGRSREALEGSRWTEAAEQAGVANRWAPWSSEPLRLLGEAELGAGKTADARRAFRSAIDRDPQNWQVWVDLALASRGAEQHRAVQRAFRLNPRSGQVRQLLERS
jgi:cytochrome c-type biogenesis protein CcmH/NrfG